MNKILQKLMVLGLLMWASIAFSQEQEVVIYPNKDAMVRNSFYGGVSQANTNVSNYAYFLSQRWTSDGVWFSARGLIEFSVASIPDDAIITEATLELSGMIHNPQERSNESYIHRVTEYWTETGVTWNNQPAYAEEGKVYLPGSTSATENYTVDIKHFVQDWVDNYEDNRGLVIKLADESTDQLTMLTFASSDNTNTAKRPKVTIKYIMPYKVTLYPDKDSYIKFIYGRVAKGVETYYNSNFGTATQIESAQWTDKGNWYNSRGLIEFDLSTLPAGVEIGKAKLTLSGLNHSTTGRSNASVMHRITESWDEKLVTWANQPNYLTSSSSINLAQSQNQNEVYEINVKDFIDGWYNNSYSNYGLMMMLQDEQPIIPNYAQLVFGSSDHTISALRPKLEVYVIPAPIDAGETTVAVSENSLGSITLNASGGIPSYTYLWELDDLPSVAEIQASLDTIPYADSLDLNADTIYQYMVNRYTGTSFTDLHEGVYTVQITDDIGATVEKEISVGGVYDLALNDGLLLSSNTLSKTDPTSGFVNGRATLDQVISHTSSSEYLWSFTVGTIDDEALVGLNKVTDNRPSDVLDIDYGIYMKNDTIIIINDSIYADTIPSLETGDQIAFLKTNGQNLALLVNGTQVYSFTTVDNDHYYADVLFSQTGNSITNMQISQLSNNETLPELMGISEDVIHVTCMSPNSGSITFNLGVNISNIQNIVWTGPSGFTSSTLTNTHLSPGSYHVTFSYTTTYNNSFTSSSLYSKSFEIGYYVDWLPEGPGIDLTAGGGFANNSSSEGILKSRNVLGSGETGWMTFDYKRENTSSTTILMGFKELVNQTNPNIYSFIDYYQQMFPKENISVPGSFTMGNGIKPYTIKVENTGRTYSTPLQNDITSDPDVTNPELLIESHVVSNQSVSQTVVSFDCPDLPRPYATLKKKLDGGYYLPQDNILFFKYDEEYYRSSTSPSQDLSCVIYQDNLFDPTPVDVTGLVAKYGDNRYQLDIQTYTGYIYILKVTNNKGEETFLKFKN